MAAEASDMADKPALLEAISEMTPTPVRSAADLRLSSLIRSGGVTDITSKHSEERED